MASRSINQASSRDRRQAKIREYGERARIRARDLNADDREWRTSIG